MTILLTTLERPNWISIYGQHYYRNEFILQKFQENDLPQFGRIVDIVITGETPLLYVEEYKTDGINNHLLSYLILRTNTRSIVLLSNLEEKQPYYSHFYRGDGEMYITLRSHVLNCHC